MTESEIILLLVILIIFGAIFTFMFIANKKMINNGTH